MISVSWEQSDPAATNRNLYILFTLAVPRSLAQRWDLGLTGTLGRSLPFEQADITWISCFHCYSSDYLPMQKSLKMISRISSAPTRPVIRPRLVRANLTPSAASARSMSRYRWYWARAAKHSCRWALWRAWVRVGAPDRGSPHLERKFENKMHQINQQLSFCALFCTFGSVRMKTRAKIYKNKVANYIFKKTTTKKHLFFF